MTGSIQVSTHSGSAEIAIPIHGPKGSAVIHAAATKTAGTWHFNRLEAVVPGREEVVDLLDEGPDT